MSRNPNRIQPTNSYLHDAWKARYCPPRSPPRREIKGPSYLTATNHHSAFLDSRQRSPSPNLPRIPYLHKDNQRYHPSPPRYTSRKPREKRRNIPEHALMTSLLSSHEEFVSKNPRNSQVRPKSMGNIVISNHPPDKPSKSNVDFSKILPIEFHKHSDDGSETSCFECVEKNQGGKNHITVSTHVIQPRSEENCTCCPECLKLRETPKNLVAQRKQFFESQIKPQSEKSEEVTEIYRNFRNVFSNSTLSKRSSSVPPSVVKTLPRNSDLFNPDYNFDCSNKKSLIESIRLKIFSKCEERKVPKFPKETRQAMSIILRNRNECLSCRDCRRRMNAGKIVDMETQTTPVASHEKFWRSRGDASKIPCTRNLLCDRGLHSGRCEENLTRKLRAVCAEGCVCRNKRRLMPFEQLIFPPENLNKEISRRVEVKSSEESLLGFLRSDFEDESCSKGDTQCDISIRVEELSFSPQNLSQTEIPRCHSEDKSSEKSFLEIFKCNLEGEGHSRINSECLGNTRGKPKDIPCKMSFA